MIPKGREDEAVGYYGGLLGLTPIPRPATFRNAGFWFRAGDQEVHLGVAEGLPAETRAHVAFSTAELDLLRARLEAADFDVREAPALDGVRRFHTWDPFGNRLEFMSAS
jgi:hypothetical protein